MGERGEVGRRGVEVGTDAAEPAAQERGWRVAEPTQTARSARGRKDWRRVLSAASPREVLARLMNGDPLGLAETIEARLRERAFLLDADRVFLRSAARCARFAVRYRGDPTLERWLAERVDEAIGDLLDAEREAERTGAEPAPEQLAVFETLARPLGIEPLSALRACAAHNRLPLEERRAFRELVIEGRSLDELAQGGPRSAPAIARAARRGLDALLQVVATSAAEEEGA